MEETASKFDFVRFEQMVRLQGPNAAVEQLITELQNGQDATALFYAQLLQKRIALGVSPYPTGSAHELPGAVHETYENSIRDAALKTGQLLIEKNQLAKAWPFFRLINEPETIKKAIETYQPGEDEDIYPIIEIAWQQGVHPEKGFELMLEKQGICSTITMLSSTDLSRNPALREQCVGKLALALHAQLRERLMADAVGRGLVCSQDVSIPELLRQYPQLTQDEGYHIDISHLQSVVQMAINLSAGKELNAARELCFYGETLSAKLNFSNDPPFDEGYTDYSAFLNILANADIEKNIARFYSKANSAMTEGIAYPGIVLVDLLSRLGRHEEAFQRAKEFFSGNDVQEYGGPNLVELARKVNNHEAVAETAKANNDIVTFLAAVISQAQILKN